VIADVGWRVAHEEPDITEAWRHEMGLVAVGAVWMVAQMSSDRQL
jgi:hypothetical protein